MSKEFYTGKEKCDLSGAVFMFSFNKIWWYLSLTVNISSFACGCMKTSSKHRMTFFLRVSGLAILIINAEKTAAPVDIP